MLICSTRVEESRPGRGEDRIATLAAADRTVIVVADGAGGVAGGAAAADFICARAAAANAQGWVERLATIDSEMSAAASCGLAAAVVLDVSRDGTVTGASVGDCEAWLFGDGEPRNLTIGQSRKPLLGSGEASPRGFTTKITNGTLVVGTDGLWKYAGRPRIVEAASSRPLDAAAIALVNAARLRNGELQDDVGVVVIEISDQANAS